MQLFVRVQNFWWLTWHLPLVVAAAASVGGSVIPENRESPSNSSKMTSRKWEKIVIQSRGRSQHRNLSHECSPAEKVRIRWDEGWWGLEVLRTCSPRVYLFPFLTVSLSSFQVQSLFLVFFSTQGLFSWNVKTNLVVMKKRKRWDPGPLFLLLILLLLSVQFPLPPSIMHVSLLQRESRVSVSRITSYVLKVQLPGFLV